MIEQDTVNAFQMLQRITSNDYGLYATSLSFCCFCLRSLAWLRHLLAIVLFQLGLHIRSLLNHNGAELLLHLQHHPKQRFALVVPALLLEGEGARSHRHEAQTLSVLLVAVRGHLVVDPELLSLVVVLVGQVELTEATVAVANVHQDRDPLPVDAGAAGLRVKVRHRRLVGGNGFFVPLQRHEGVPLVQVRRPQHQIGRPLRVVLQARRVLEAGEGRVLLGLWVDLGLFLGLIRCHNG
jgi:hypothetical protein